MHDAISILNLNVADSLLSSLTQKFLFHGTFQLMNANIDQEHEQTNTEQKECSIYASKRFRERSSCRTAWNIPTISRKSTNAGENVSCS